MPDRDALLRNLRPGDLFHASCPSGASLVCLVESLTETEIRTRRITTQEAYAFDRRTGLTLPNSDPRPCKIDSVAPLPTDILNIMLGIDRKSRLEHDPERIKLSKDEIKAFNFIDGHYKSNPL